MHSKFLVTLLIFMLVLGVMPVAAAELPTAPVLATDAAPQAQPSRPERQMPPGVRELSADRTRRACVTNIRSNHAARSLSAASLG